MKIALIFLSTLLYSLAHPIEFHNDPFRQLEEVWPTPTENRIASGAPGPKYWQQRADYDIKIKLDEKKNKLTGSAQIVYHNKSPHTLEYLWMQLDRNKFTPGSLGHQSSIAPKLGKLSYDSLESLLLKEKFDGQFHITDLVDKTGAELNKRIVDTMMRVDLPKALKPNQSFTLKIAWHYTLTDSRTSWGRSNFEKFENGGKIYEVAQWFPRMCAYTDVRGWQNKAFQGRGEFALEFGDYRVAITAPADHIVASTGELKNQKDCLEPVWIERLNKAKTSKKPILIVTPEEAKKNEEKGTRKTKTWIFEAKNVRDFAWASSRKFIWDAIHHELPNSKKKVWAMSYYPNEGNPLWEQYSTHSIVHTLNVYSKYTFDYPYPVAISVNGPVYGMEYPMICFNGPRPEKDGTYPENTKHRLISVIIHEVGHNWFPMIVNSDERQWTWMDEGLNSFLQIVAEQEWQTHYPSSRPGGIVGYMSSPNQRPIMTNSESILQFGANAYTKPAIGLNILRETIMGRKLFDDAFQKYSRRWMFKSPEPSDFFRTMEDASGMDLDWFWRTWFYTTDHVDMAVTGITQHVVDTGDPDKKASEQKKEHRETRKANITTENNRDIPKYVDENDLFDFYDKYKKFKVSEKDRKKFHDQIENLKPDERSLLKTNKRFTIVNFENKGGVIMPLLVELHFEGGGKELRTIPAEIWKKNHKEVSKLFVTKEPVIKVVLDPRKQTADTVLDNNVWPPQIDRDSYTPYRKQKSDGGNPMRTAQKEKEAEEKKRAEEKNRREAEKKKAAEKKNTEKKTEASKPK